MKTTLWAGTQFTVWLSLLCGSAAFAADTQLVWRPDELNQAAWGAAANYDSYAQRRPEDLAFVKYVIELYRRRPNADPQQVIAHINDARRRFREKYQRGDPSPPGQPNSGVPRYDWFNGALNILSDTPGADEVFIPLMITTYRESKSLSDALYHRAMAPVYRLDSLLQEALRLEAERLDNRRAFPEAFALEQSNPRAAVVLQSVLGRSASQSAQQIFDGSPAWASDETVQAIRGLMNQRGELVASMDQLKTLLGTELQKLQATVNSNVTLLQSLAAGQEVLYRYMTNAQLRALEEERITRAQAAYDQKIKAANASVYILSTLVGFKDPELGRQMHVVGGSAVQIADAVHTFTKGQVGALGSVILTGNIVGAVMNVVSLFSAGGPSPDQQILEEIARLQEMVHQLRVEMHERFDRVDAALNEIYRTMNERFDRIDVVLGILRGDVEEIQESLYNLQSDLYRIERKVFEFLEAGFRRDLNETINGYLGYRETYGEPIPLLSYRFAENKFHTWATINALDEISSGIDGRSFDDASLYAALTSKPFENNLNYISQYLATKGWPAFTTVRLANPRDWAIAANAWMDLAAESPLFFRGVSSNRLEQIYRVGLDLQRAFTNIALLNGGAGPANTALFNALIANYRGKAVLFRERLREQERQYRLSLSQDPQRQQAFLTLDFWGGSDQDFSSPFGPSPEAVQPGQNNHGATNEIPLPQNFQQMLPSFVKLGEFLQVGSLKLEYHDFDLVDRVTGEWFCWNIGRLYSAAIGKFQILIKGYASNDLVLERSYLGPSRDTGPFQCGVNGEICQYAFSVPPDLIVINDDGTGQSALHQWTWNSALVSIWSGGLGGVCCGDRTPTPPVQEDFQNRAQLVTSATQDAGIVAFKTRIQNRLLEFQRGTFSSISDALERVTDFQSAARELSGAKQLLNSLVVLGFPQSIESDDFIRALLFGDEQLVDTDVAKGFCQLGIARTYDTNQNTKVDIGAILDERIAALEMWVSNRLSQVQTNGAESLRLVTSTLSRLDAFRAGWSRPSPAPRLAPLGLRLTNGVPNRLFIVWGEPNVLYTVQSSPDLLSWTDLPTPADEGTDYITTPTGRSAFYRAVLRP